MDAYATASDLEKRWRKLVDDEVNRASTLLSDASVRIAAECRRSGVSVEEPDEAMSSALRIVACEMVKRAMASPVNQSPVTQGSMTAGPYSESWTYANPTGALYMTKAERRLLGIGPRASFANPWGDAT